ncbi:hypothetical protein OQA88_8638 [Cercophora sp. LCS_1]
MQGIVVALLPGPGTAPLELLIKVMQHEEIASITILAYLLHNENSSILQTRGPFNTAFIKNADDGFSIDVKPELRTLLFSGIAPLKVSTYRGLGVVCLNLRKETAYILFSHSQERDEKEWKLASLSYPGSQDKKILGIYNAHDLLYQFLYVRSDPSTMEPISALSLVGDVVGLIETGLRSVKTARKIYHSATGSTSENESLALLAGEVRKRAMTLETKHSSVVDQASPSASDEDGQSLDNIARNCRKIADEVLALLSTLQTAQQKSVKHTIAATWRNFRKKEEKEELVAQLERLAAQLHQQMMFVNQSETLSHLEELVAVGAESAEKLGQLQAQLDVMRVSTNAEVFENDAFGSLRTRLDRSDDIVTKSRNNVIKLALSTHSLDSRFLEVSNAHSKTFEWILEDQEGNQEATGLGPSFEEFMGGDLKAWEAKRNQRRAENMQQPGRQHAGSEFVKWLGADGGGGVFHISGKPGAGKSTLMKFLCQNPRTRGHLATWADGAGKTLVFSQFFFWKEGTKAQRSLFGLLRGLLFHILDNAPQLTVAAFPDLWDVTATHGAAVSSIPDSAVEASFNRLMTNPDIYRNHRFAFFIDGLDEYEGDYRQHAEMIKRLFGWVESGMGNVKLCISSREWNMYLDGFAACPKLKLQDLTLHDMRLLVTGRLGSNTQFQARASAGEDLSFLETTMVTKAEGVFLWLYLVLNMVEECIGDGADVDSIRATLECLPSDLEQLFEKHFDSIPAQHMQSALRTFAAVLEATNAKIDLLLYRYSFLDQHHKDGDFALSMTPAKLNPEQIEARLSLARRRVAGSCRGFLEIRKSEVWRQEPSFGEYITMTHRSLADFLRQKCTWCSFRSADTRDGLLQSFVAHIKTIPLTGPYFDNPRRRRHFVNELEYFLMMTFKHPDEVDVQRVSLVLDEIEKTVGTEYWSSLHAARDDRYPTMRSRGWGILYSTHQDKISFANMPVETMITGRAIYDGSHEFLKHQIERGNKAALSHVSTGHALVNVLRRMMNDTALSNTSALLPLSEWVKTLNLLFHNGLSAAYQLEPWTRLWSSWPHLLWYIIFSTSQPRPNRNKQHPYIILLEAFLHFGAKSDMTFCVKSAPPRTAIISPCDIPKDDESTRCQDTLPMVRLALSKGGVVSLRDLVGLWIPRQKERLEVLIDNNIAGVADTSGFWESLLEMRNAQIAETIGEVHPLLAKSKDIEND